MTSRYRRRYQYQRSAGDQPPANPQVAPLDWFVALSVPTRRKLRAPPWQFVTDPAQIAISIEWHQPLATPVLRKSDHAAQVASGGIDEFTEFAAPEVVTLDKWFAGLSEPTLRRTRPHGLFVDEFSEFVAPPETVTLDKWYGPLSEPLFRKPFHQAPWLIGAFATTTPVVVELGWYQALSEPVRPAHIGYLSGETSILLDIAAIPDIEFSWYSEWPDVVASRWSMWRFVTAAEWGSNVEIEPDTWFQPLSEPVRRKHFDPTTETRDILQAVPPPPPITIDHWQQPLSTPVLPRPPRQLAGEFAPDVTAFAAPETVTLDKWFQPAGEPIRIKRPVNKATGESAPEFTPAEETSADKWDAPVSQPLFAKHGRNPATGESAPVFVEPPPPTPPDYGWFVALVGPVPRLVSRHAALAQAYGDPNVPLPTVAAPDDDWTDTTPEGGTWTPTTTEGGIWTDVPQQGGTWS